MHKLQQCHITLTTCFMLLNGYSHSPLLKELLPRASFDFKKQNKWLVKVLPDLSSSARMERRNANQKDSSIQEITEEHSSIGHGTKNEYVREWICNPLPVNQPSHTDTHTHANTSTKCESMLWTGDKVDEYLTGTQQMDHWERCRGTLLTHSALSCPHLFI